MANVPTSAWSETAPAGTDNASAGDDAIRLLKTQIRQVIDVDHDFPSSGQAETTGQHKQITLQEQADLGTGAEGVPILGAQTVSGKAELVFTDEDDNDVQVTDNGKIKIASVDNYANNTFIKSKDSAGTGTVDLIKANASNVTVINDGAQLETSTAPTTDAAIANKKYVDDTVPVTVRAYFSVNSGSLTTNGAQGCTVARTSTGLYVITFTTEFADANYAVLITAKCESQDESLVGYVSSRAVGSVTIKTELTNASSPTLADGGDISVLVIAT